MSASSTSVTVSAVVATITFIFGVIQWSAESKARQIEIELRAFVEFAKVVETANGRGPVFLSEECVKSAEDPKDCLLRGPLGLATQLTAIQSLASFGERFQFLTEPAKSALEELKNIDGLEISAQTALSRL